MLPDPILAANLRSTGFGNRTCLGEYAMNAQLMEDDRRAIDLLLDQGLSPDASGGGRAGFAPPSMDSVRVRLRRASELLKMLHYMPSMEPPSDLVARTMARIDASIDLNSPFVPNASEQFDLDGTRA
jgi:hypothetical protein